MKVKVIYKNNGKTRKIIICTKLRLRKMRGNTGIVASTLRCPEQFICLGGWYGNKKASKNCFSKLYFGETQTLPSHMYIIEEEIKGDGSYETEINLEIPKGTKLSLFRWRMLWW